MKFFLSFYTAVLLITTLAAFTAVKAQHDHHYYFAFDSDHGHYTDIVSCGHSPSLSGSHRGDFHTYGPYETDHAAHDKLDDLKHHYNDDHHDHAEYVSGLHCD